MPPPAPPRPVVVVLAAGRSQRFGAAGHKLGQSFGPGHTVLGHTVGQVVKSGLPLLVVTTAPFRSDVGRWVSERDVLVLPAVADTTSGAGGMGASIAAAVFARAEAPGWLILPGDMPLVRSSTLRQVADALERHPIVHAQHRGLRGHPVGFGAEMFSELVRLSGDQGARRLLARYPAEGVEVDDPGVLVDVDTPDDLDVARRVRAAAAVDEA